jgi:hypothetical protein
MYRNWELGIGNLKLVIRNLELGMIFHCHPVGIFYLVQYNTSKQKTEAVPTKISPSSRLVGKSQEPNPK